MTPACNHDPEEVEAERSEDQGCIGLHDKLKVSLGYMTPNLKRQKKKKNPPPLKKIKAEIELSGLISGEIGHLYNIKECLLITRIKK